MMSASVTARAPVARVFAARPARAGKVIARADQTGPAGDSSRGPDGGSGGDPAGGEACAYSPLAAPFDRRWSKRAFAHRTALHRTRARCSPFALCFA